MNSVLYLWPPMDKVGNPRKRVRSDGDEESRDFTPLSKRINNLHINNGVYCNSTSASFQKTNQDIMSDRDQCGPSHCDPSPCNGRSDDVILTPSAPLQGIIPQPLYSPDLTISDNPFYYEPNKVLFYLYIERMQRSGHNF